MTVSFPKCNIGNIDFVISMDEKNMRENVHFLSDDFPIAMYTQHYSHATRDHIPFHWHDELQMTWVFEGRLEYCVNGDTFSLSHDKILLINSQLMHSSRTVSQDARALCIDFGLDIFHPLVLKHYILPFLETSSFSYSLLPLKPYQPASLDDFLNWTKAPSGYFSIINFLSQMFESVIRDFKKDEHPVDYDEIEMFHTVLNYIYSHYAEPLTVQQLAVQIMTNKNRLTDLFKKYTNMAPIKFLNEYRLYIAQNLIIHTDKPISEISEDVGYNQLSYFIQQFRDNYGLSPLKYRNKYGQKAEGGHPSITPPHAHDPDCS